MVLHLILYKDNLVDMVRSPGKFNERERHQGVLKRITEIESDLHNDVRYIPFSFSPVNIACDNVDVTKFAEGYYNVILYGIYRTAILGNVSEQLQNVGKQVAWDIEGTT